MTSATRAKQQRRNGTRRSTRQLTRAVNSWVHAADSDSALTWAAHLATPGQLREIAQRADDIEKSVCSFYDVTDDDTKDVICQRVTAALMIDAANVSAALPGEAIETDAKLVATLDAIRRDLSRRAGARLCPLVVLVSAGSLRLRQSRAEGIRLPATPIPARNAGQLSDG